MLNKKLWMLLQDKSNKMPFPDYTNAIASTTIGEFKSYTVPEDCFASITLKRTGYTISYAQLLVNNNTVLSSDSLNNTDYICLFLKKNDIITCDALHGTIYVKLFALKDS